MAQSLEQAIATFDRTAAAARSRASEDLRSEFRSRFPEEAWPDIPLERFALGQDDSSDTYCKWIEYKTPGLGSMGGGSSAKHVIYKRKNKPGWHYPQQFGNEQEAWVRIRSDVVLMLQRARQGNWEFDDLIPFQHAIAIWIKTLHIYLPNQVLPVCSREHLARFWYLLSGEDPKRVRKTPPVTLNRNLLERLRAQPALEGLNSNELSYFLYHWDDPRLGLSVYKIAPGEGARFWDDCLAGQYMCVGWGEVGDLKDFEDFESFEPRFRQACGPEYGDTPAGRATTVRKARELWRLRQIKPGDLIVANRGMSEILGVGTVQDPPYEWAVDGAEYPHRILVTWDTTKGREIPAQAKWAFVTIAPMSLEEYERLTAGAVSSPDQPPPRLEIDSELAQLGDRLEERKQLIFYGPPGTGKTYMARRLILHWLLAHENRSPAEILADNDRSRLEWKRLTSAEDGPSQVTMVTFHPSYGYEDFIEGYRPQPSGGAGLELRLEAGLFVRVCRAAEAAPSKRFVVLIDEINRGNLPRILGELITVLEADKRGLHVVLPQSKTAFAVPPNVYIIGTMNTADRSVRVLDAAIRRRFTFCELMPDSALLAGRQFGDLVLQDFFEYLNRLVAKREGREKQIGHSVFMDEDEPVDSIEEFARRFRHEVVPLLQEYCYDDYAALETYLGSELVDAEGQRLKNDVLDEPETMVAALVRQMARQEVA